jgi:hypothetical protein
LFTEVQSPIVMADRSPQQGQDIRLARRAGWIPGQQVAGVAFVALFALTLLSPVSLSSLGLVNGKLLPVDLDAPGAPTARPAWIDLDGDGGTETLDLSSAGVATIASDGRVLWRSPSTWTVRQADFTDLNRDGRPEVSLLVWRAFQPWPTDRLLPHGGRIAGFQNAFGESCHLILVGADRHGGIRELWAGSALAEPITSFVAADLDRDGRQELITLETRYAHDPSATEAGALKVWEWNGFGFTVVDQALERVSRFVLVRTGGSSLILAQVAR